MIPPVDIALLSVPRFRPSALALLALGAPALALVLVALLAAPPTTRLFRLAPAPRPTRLLTPATALRGQIAPRWAAWPESHGVAESDPSGTPPPARPAPPPAPLPAGLVLTLGSFMTLAFAVFLLSKGKAAGEASQQAPAAIPLGHVVVAGGTGFVGQRMVRHLVDRGVSVTVLTRSATKSRVLFGVRPVKIVEWDGTGVTPVLLEALTGVDAVISLIGEPVVGRWSESKKTALRDSRLLPTQSLVRAIASLPDESIPKVFVSTSAVGYYGSVSRMGPELRETAPPGQDFLARLCVDWEKAAMALEPRVRVVTPRLGIVLGREAGVLGNMIPAFMAGAGGPIGSGQQAISWVHISDVLRAYTEVAQNPAYHGPVNVTAPGCCTMSDLASALARALRRPYFGIPVPSPVVRMALGEGAAVLVEGQTVYPQRLLDGGFRFEFPDVGPAVTNAITARPT